MNTGHVWTRGGRHGTALLITLLFLALFASMAVALAVASDTNLAIARNRIQINQARNLVETGLMLAMRAMGNMQVSGDTAADLHASIAEGLRNAWADCAMLEADDITADADGVTVPPITVRLPDGQTGTISLFIQADGGVDDAPTVTVTSTARFGEAVRTAYYDFGVQNGFTLLSSYGVASRSPIEIRGHARIDGANEDSEGSIYSSSDAAAHGVEIRGSATVTGDAAVSAEGVDVYVGGSATVGGDIIEDAPEHEWPSFDTSVFEAYATNVYDGDGNESNGTFTNLRIPAGTNPTFNGNTQLYGVIYIESPNKVTFNGNTNICGVVVCEEPTVTNYSRNQLKFNGNLTASGVEYLPDDPEFDGIRDLTGTFLLAPGFYAKFAGNFSTINGYIVAGKFKFSGNAAGTVRGGVLNLDDSAFIVSGNAHITIDKQNAADQPAGFSRRYALVCLEGSYRE